MLSSSGCQDSTSINSNVERKFYMHPGVDGFDWDNDPLQVTINEKELQLGMGRDTLDLVVKDLYSYFHTMNTGDSLDWITHLTHFPIHRYSDTTFLNQQYRSTKHWMKEGFYNRSANADIKYVSSWVREDDQDIALIGYDTDFYLDFLPHFTGNPEGMKFILEDRYGRDAIEYNSFHEIKENGDSVLIRNWHAHAFTSLFVITTHDSLHFSFLPEGFNKGNLGNGTMMEPETILTLLRLKRKQTAN